MKDPFWLVLGLKKPDEVLIFSFGLPTEEEAMFCTKQGIETEGIDDKLYTMKAFNFSVGTDKLRADLTQWLIHEGVPLMDAIEIINQLSDSIVEMMDGADTDTLCN